ncbi:hypothetical protein JOL79_09455 [Microbispora sp. RL4-1S]|uniref:Diacylglycerol glucosyltransferase N-terminal domain-containing protein n=2 Tax=Microbispora oryzae TaxID=2806554 RepID=A0A940WFZ3_9ACTN|nr:hypothetical protein [Microbispora oryzae]
MGAGHDGVAAELARRLAARGVVTDTADVLDLLPLRLGAALRRGYRWAVGNAPWLYELVYRVFFVSRHPPPASPLTLVVAARLERLVRRARPAAVVSTFHVAAQAAGHLRAKGRLGAPSVVVVTDFAAHRLWLHPGNDAYLCSDEATAAYVAEATGRPARPHAPLVRPEFAAARRAASGSREHGRRVIISAGSWGVGRVEEAARVLAATGRYVPVVLCGGNERLRRRLRSAVGPGLALGWRDDVPGLLASAYALVDNAAGLTCKEAFAAGVPVISYRPIPGHGRDGALAMARAGLGRYARGPAELVEALDELGELGELDRPGGLNGLDALGELDRPGGLDRLDGWRGGPGATGRAALLARADALFLAPQAEDLLPLGPGTA